MDQCLWADTDQNPDLNGRKGEWNLGVDFAALNNRLNVTVDLYTRKVSDLLYKYKVPTPPLSIFFYVGECWRRYK